MAMRLFLLLLVCSVLGCRTTSPAAPSIRPKPSQPEVQTVAFNQEIDDSDSATDQLDVDSERDNGVDSDAGEADESDEAGRSTKEGEAKEIQADSITNNSSSQEPPASGQFGTASLEELLQLACHVSPAIGKLVARIEALKGKHCQAGLPPNPTVGINGTDINEDGSPGRYGVYYGNTIVRGNKLGLSQQIVRNEIRQAEIELNELRQRLMTDVKLRYYEILIAIKKSNLAIQLVELSQEAVDATQLLLEAKEIARTALIQAELEMQSAQIQQQRAQNQLRGARRNLAALLGETDLQFDSFSGSLQEENEIDIEAEFDRILAASPEIEKMYAAVAVAQSNLQRQRVQAIGNVSWQTSVAYDFESDDVVSGFQIGLPIPKFNQNQGAICQARQEIVAAENDVQVRSLQIRQKLVQSFQTYRDAKMQVEAYEAKVLPRARETLELIIEGFQQGEVDFLQLLTAQRTYFGFNLTVIEQQRIMWRNRIAIEGMLLSGSLDQ